VLGEGVVPEQGERPSILVHAEGDHVGIAVEDLEPGRYVVGWMDSGRRDSLEVVQAVPLGHKVALEDLPEDAEVIEYGLPVAVTKEAIGRGSHVHVHNIRSGRWAKSA